MIGVLGAGVWLERTAEKHAEALYMNSDKVLAANKESTDKVLEANRTVLASNKESMDKVLEANRIVLAADKESTDKVLEANRKVLAANKESTDKVLAANKESADSRLNKLETFVEVYIAANTAVTTSAKAAKPRS